MKSVVINSKKVSQMTLGTVQLGMNYGIANNEGQPDVEKSINMLKCAVENGISSFDTARAYGTSEEVIGNFLKYYKNSDNLYITSKLIVGLTDDAKEKEIEKTMFDSVELSLEKLGIQKLDCLMLHRSNEINQYGNIVPRIMEKLILKGYINSAGASVYSGDELDDMLCYDVFTATQLPMNIFDQNLIHNGYIDKLYKKKISVFVRSVFLQGLFFLDYNNFTDPLLIEYVKPYLIKLHEICNKTGMSIAEIAISFIRDIPGVTSLVLGADSCEHIMQNISYMNAPKLSEDVRNEISVAFKDVNTEKIMEVLRRPKN